MSCFWQRPFRHVPTGLGFDDGRSIGPGCEASPIRIPVCGLYDCWRVGVHFRIASRYVPPVAVSGYKRFQLFRVRVPRGRVTDRMEAGRISGVWHPQRNPEYRHRIACVPWGLSASPALHSGPHTWPGPGKEARRKLRTLSHRCQMTQQMRHATPDPVRNQVCHVEPRIAIPIPAQCPGSCGTESRTQRRTLFSIGRIPQRFPHAPPYLEGTCRTVSNPCRVQQWIPHAIVGNNRGPVGNASIPYDLDSNVRPAD